jgi:hypothetical protein
MGRAEDFKFSVPLQGPENKWHFFGSVAASNVERTQKSNHRATRIRIPFAAVSANIASITSWESNSRKKQRQLWQAHREDRGRREAWPVCDSEAFLSPV